MKELLIYSGIYVVVWIITTVYFKWLENKDYVNFDGASAVVAVVWPLTLPYVLVDRLTDWIGYLLTKNK